jgi:hypothetical protein
MTRLGIAALIVCACGPSQPTGQTMPGSLLDEPGSAAPVVETKASDETAPVARAPVTPPGILTPAQACSRVRTLFGQGCEWTDRFPPEFFKGENCEASIATWVAPDRADKSTSEAVMSCWALDCEAAVPCMVDANGSRPPPPPRACGDEGATAIQVDAKTWDARRGRDIKRFSEAKTTEAAPIEVCDIDGEVEWMKRATCNDGSNPYQTDAEVNERRDGYFARGGKCNSILDRYSVPCPEGTYSVHIDRYVCPAT